jgi:cysteine desulfurase family protein (TIGR01976 family)
MVKADSKEFPIAWVRGKFPAVKKAEEEQPPFAFMDNAGGAQVPEEVLGRVEGFFLEQNVNLHGPYRHSEVNTQFVEVMRRRMGEFLGASSEHEIVFGLNATTIMRLFSTSFAQTLKQGDEIIISGLEHEADVTPWLRLQSLGATIRFWQPRGDEALLQEGDLKALLSERTRLVAVTGASNLLGTINDCAGMAELAHEAGALLFIDGVHSAPHVRTRVQGDGIDVFVCSGYKVFGAHVGIAAVRRGLMDRLPSLNHYFLKSLKLELGTQNFEGLAAMDGVLEYFQALAKQMGNRGEDAYDFAFRGIGRYEQILTRRILEGLRAIDGVRIYGIISPERFSRRTPTVAFNIAGKHPRDVAKRLGQSGFGVNNGDLYAARIVDWLGLKNSGGVVRASLCHYNTIEEIDGLLKAVREIVEG